MENLIYAKKPRQNSVIYSLFLVLSFLWLSIYPTMSSFLGEFTYGYGNLLSEGMISIVAVNVFAEAISSWIAFEILFWAYRWILSFKIYSFIVPMDSFKAETRLYFIFRNVFLGIIYNLCFLFPYLFAYSVFFDLVVTMIVLVCFAKHLNANYAETIVGHFVFKNFCYPIFVYEAIEILCSILVVI